jgi:hypothetical protein
MQYAKRISSHFSNQILRIFVAHRLDVTVSLALLGEILLLSWLSVIIRSSFDAHTHLSSTHEQEELASLQDAE